ncbi:MAG: hypothetical protein J2P16_00315 [Mycobacterium sp.]|nr:hypothetical protein [Mycobacterium sp.]
MIKSPSFGLGVASSHRGTGDPERERSAASDVRYRAESDDLAHLDPLGC